jgi:hypothetical protein
MSKFAPKMTQMQFCPAEKQNEEAFYKLQKKLMLGRHRNPSHLLC